MPQLNLLAGMVQSQSCPCIIGSFAPVLVAASQASSEAGAWDVRGDAAGGPKNFEKDGSAFIGDDAVVLHVEFQPSSKVEKHM